MKSVQDILGEVGTKHARVLKRLIENFTPKDELLIGQAAMLYEEMHHIKKSLSYDPKDLDKVPNHVFMELQIPRRHLKDLLSRFHRTGGGVIKSHPGLNELAKLEKQYTAALDDLMISKKTAKQIALKDKELESELDVLKSLADEAKTY